MNYYNPSQSWHAGSELWSVKAFVCCLSYHGRWNSHSTVVTWPDTPLSAPACIFYLQRMFCLFMCYHHCINGKIGISFLSLGFWPACFLLVMEAMPREDEQVALCQTTTLHHSLPSQCQSPGTMSWQTQKMKREAIFSILHLKAVLSCSHFAL